MKYLKEKFVIGLLAAVCAFSCFGCGIGIASRDEAKKAFYRNRNALNAIVKLFGEEDKRLFILSKDREVFDGQSGPLGKYSKIAKARLREYKQLFRKLTFSPTIFRHERTGNLLIVYDSDNFVFTCKEIGYAYVYSV